MRPGKSEAEDEAKAGCYEAEAKHFGLEANLPRGLNIPGNSETGTETGAYLSVALSVTNFDFSST